MKDIIFLCFLLFVLVLVSLFLSSNGQTLDPIEVGDENEFLYVETGKGPKSWGTLKPEWETCGKGDLQSPIDLLHTRVELIPQYIPFKKDYKPAQAIVKNRGHDIMVKWKEDAGKLELDGTVYNLIQAHWHSPAEHTLNSSKYDLELHIVHESADQKLAVIGLLYKIGQPDPFLTQLLKHIISVGEDEIELGILNPKDIDLGRGSFYRYIGSLTVPPCTQGVLWTIPDTVMTVSSEQVHALRVAVHDGFENNARPLQESNGRPVIWFNPVKNEI